MAGRSTIELSYFLVKRMEDISLWFWNFLAAQLLERVKRWL
jgi:hypothetical protein